ncbi:hypothetical protein Tco_0606511 [Tanacetum coccineum]
MMMLFYVDVGVVVEIYMFEHGFDAAHMMVLLYVTVSLGFQFHIFQWGDFDAAQFGSLFMLWLLRMLLRQVMMANRNRADDCGVGTVQIKFTSGKTVTLHNVLYVLTISKSLVSVGKHDEHGFKIAIKEGCNK